MTNKEILKKAYQKVIENGYVDYAEIKDSVDDIYAEEDVRFIRFSERAIIFDHDFAKAFWKSKIKGVTVYRCNKHPENDFYSNTYCGQCGSKMLPEERLNTEWKTRLEEMVLEENPVQYLAKFL